MKKAFLKLKESLSKRFNEEDDFETSEESQNYLELDTYKDQANNKQQKILVKTFTVEDFQDVKPILDAVREGYSIALVNIRPIREKDVIELKRTVNKLKKTVEAIDGDIAGFGDDWIVVTPQFAKVYRSEEDDAKEADVDSEYSEF